MAHKLSLNSQILIGCVVGIAGGLALQAQGQAAFAESTLYGAKLVGNLFLDLLRMILVPLVFSSIVGGVANLRAHDQMHRVWTTTLLFFFATMGLAILILNLTLGPARISPERFPDFLHPRRCAARNSRRFPTRRAGRCCPHSRMRLPLHSRYPRRRGCPGYCRDWNWQRHSRRLDRIGRLR